MICHAGQQTPTAVTSEAGALEMACVVANVEHIIICGHADCKACM